MERRNWTRNELILAFNLYCKIPFGSFHTHNQKVNELAELICRTPSAVAIKLANFASFDNFHQERGVKGMQNSGKLDKKIWDEFTSNWNDLIYESEKLLQTKKKEISNEGKKKYYPDFDFDKIGFDKIRDVKTRVNQNFFRLMVLNSNDFSCSITGINIPDLLIASHIVPWSKNEKERLNPSNGICLSSSYDSAFDKGLISIKPDFTIVLSEEIKVKRNESYYYQYFGQYEGKKITVPNKFHPNPEFLDYHFNELFRK